MADDTDESLWFPPFAGFQRAGEEAVEQQTELMQRMFSGGMGNLSDLGAMSRMGAFKTRVQSGGRISIPDAEREALDIEEGDIVQTVVIPIKRSE